MLRFPTVSRTFVHAPPGAGKTTAIIEMMKHWQARALVITFNKSNQETMEQRIKAACLPNADAKTLDSLCIKACGRPKLMKWSDWELCRAFWPESAKAKFCGVGAGRRSSDIINFRFRHPRATVTICKTHRQLAAKGTDWDAGFASYPMQTIARTCQTFAASRYVCDQKQSLRATLDSYDIILVDEVQDLLSAQELRLLFQTSRPVVMVGDPMQAINNFRDDPPCTECALVQEPTPPLPRAIEWYGTWRLDGFTVRFIEERFQRSMFSYRTCSDNAEVYWKNELVYENTLVLCRYNESVVEAAKRFPDARVVSGDTLASRLSAASNDDSMVTPMAKYAQVLKLEGMLSTVCDLLRERSIRLSDVKGVPAISTVHQAKGFEYDHCAVHSDLLSPKTENERNVSFVAFTRHRKSLVVLENNGLRPQPVARTVADETPDITDEVLNAAMDAHEQATAQ